MHLTVDLALGFLTSRPFVYEPEDLPVCSEGVGRLDACKPPSTLPSTLIQHPFEEGLESTARDGLQYLDRILSNIFVGPLKRVRLTIR
jgi:hypothetical protein